MERVFTPVNAIITFVNSSMGASHARGFFCARRGAGGDARGLRAGAGGLLPEPGQENPCGGRHVGGMSEAIRRQTRRFAARKIQCNGDVPHARDMPVAGMSGARARGHCAGGQNSPQGYFLGIPSSPPSPGGGTGRGRTSIECARKGTPFFLRSPLRGTGGGDKNTI